MTSIVADVHARLLREAARRYGKVVQRIVHSGSFARERDANLVPDAMHCSRANHHIAEAIDARNPFLLSRFGRIELAICVDSIVTRRLGKNSVRERMLRTQRVIPQISENDRRRAWQMSGIFPSGPDANDAVAKKYLSAAESIDTLAVWNMPWEAMARQVTCPQARTVDPIVLNAFELFPPWTARLKGLRVLVVSPFARTIRAQYGKRRQIWPGSEVLPDFELVTLEAAQTLGFETAGYPDWFAALNAMEEEMLSLTPFDVAIIGAGAYGLPLAAAAKNAGAVALHVGGVHQLYFGIRGKRWEKGVMSEDTVHYAQYFNDSWVRPEEARPSGMNGADDGFYW